MMEPIEFIDGWDLECKKETEKKMRTRILQGSSFAIRRMVVLFAEMCKNLGRADFGGKISSPIFGHA